MGRAFEPYVQAEALPRVAPQAAAETVERVTTTPTTIEALFAEHARFVWRTLRHFGVAEPDLEDQTQEVFLIAHRRAAEWDGTAPRPWLAAIARRCAAAYRRRSHRRHEQAVESVPEGSDTRDPSARTEVELLGRALDTLDEESRTIFVLHAIEEIPMREIADIVQLPLHTAYRRFHAARLELTRLLEGTP